MILLRAAVAPVLLACILRQQAGYEGPMRMLSEGSLADKVVEFHRKQVIRRWGRVRRALQRVRRRATSEENFLACFSGARATNGPILPHQRRDLLSPPSVVSLQVSLKRFSTLLLSPTFWSSRKLSVFEISGHIRST